MRKKIGVLAALSLWSLGAQAMSAPAPQMVSGNSSPAQLPCGRMTTDTVFSNREKVPVKLAAVLDTHGATSTGKATGAKK